MTEDSGTPSPDSSRDLTTRPPQRDRKRGGGGGGEGRERVRGGRGRASHESTNLEATGMT